MSKLTPDQIFDKYQNGEMDKSTVLNQIKSNIENSEEEELRVDSLKVIPRIDNSPGDSYLFIENLLISDANPLIRATAAEIILNNYMEQGIKAIKWAINNDKSWECLLRIYELLKAKKTEISEVLLKEMENSLGKPYIEKCGLNSEEAIYLGVLKKNCKFALLNIVDCLRADTTGSLVSITTEKGFVTEIEFREEIPDFNILKYFKKLRKIHMTLKARDGFENLSILTQLNVLILEECLFRTKEDLKWLESLVNLKELQR